MRPPFDLNDAIKPGPGTGLNRFLAAVIVMAIRDGADHIFLEPVPSDVESRLQYRLDGKLYDLIPPPARGIAPLVRSLEGRVVGLTADEGFCGWLPSRFDGRDFSIWAFADKSGTGVQLTLRLPPLPELSGSAARLLEISDMGLITFDDADFA